MFEIDPSGVLRVFGVALIGANAQNGKKLLLTLAFIVAILLLAWVLRQLIQGVAKLAQDERVSFWGRQVVNILAAVLLFVSLVSIWFDDPTRLTTALGLFTAGVAFALQRVITATAGYFVILRGKTFSLGDRIVMGGVRGDVIGLSFMQTTIMEMGQPPGEQADEPSMWVRSRQYTGRIVSVSNAKIFDEAVYNYSREFPFLWEEMTFPIRYSDDRHKVEQILLDAARRHTAEIGELGDADLKELQRRYGMPHPDTAPRVYWRMTDNWLELSLRFLSRDRNSRELKDALSREILDRLDEAHIGLASATYEIVAVPPLRLESSSSVRGRALS
jgi:small-conductance mechanosensitive channel